LVKSDTHRLLRQGCYRTLIVFFLLAAYLCGGLGRAQFLFAQSLSAPSPSDSSDSISGVVLNSLTREPIARALVSSPDNRFAMLTNSEGRFEFTFAKGEAAGESSDSNGAVNAGRIVSNAPFTLTARKPGFLTDRNNFGPSLQNESLKELTLTLTPESLIVGTVALPTAEAPDSITVQIFRRQVREGRAHWVGAGATRSTSDGRFRFAGLSSGTYKLLTNELLDRDPAVVGPVNPVNVGRLSSDWGGPLFGYPPAYYQNAFDFESASTIQLAAGQTQAVNLTLVKQPYYWVKMPVIFPSDLPGNRASENGVGVIVYSQGRRGPGFALGYNNADHSIEGMLPNGTYTIEASSLGDGWMSGLQLLTVKGAPNQDSTIGHSKIGDPNNGDRKINGPALALVPSASIPVAVKEEFTSPDNTGGTTTWTISGHRTVVRGPRRYLNVRLEPADDFGLGGVVSLREPTGAGDDALAIQGAAVGSYWVIADSSRGYVASIRSGSLDLQHQPLVVGAGGAVSPIEITMRDDMAEISGTVDGIAPQAQETAGAGASDGSVTPYPTGAGKAAAYIYCIPLADSSGQFTEVGVRADGGFDSAGMAPGAYRLLAFDRRQPDLEYRSSEPMQAFDSRGFVVRVAGGQKERVTLQLISTN
jgi:hypothetical protein